MATTYFSDPTKGRIGAFSKVRLKPTFLTTSEKNRDFHKYMENNITNLLDERNEILKLIDETPDLNATKKLNLFKLLKDNQQKIDNIDENMKVLRIFSTLKDPITGKIKNFGQ